MPAYYFHLAFELSCHSFRDSASETLTIAKEITSYLPPQNLNIFTDDLPLHSETPWTSILAPRKEFKRSRSSFDQGLARTRDRDTAARPHSSSESATSERSIAVREKSSKPAAASAIEVNDSLLVKRRQDWRLGRISVDSIDMESRDAPASGDTRPRPAAPGANQYLTAKYIPSKVKTTEFGVGVVHLYRDEIETPAIGQPSNQQYQIDEDTAFLDEDCTTLCILAVPSYMTPSDVLGWMGEKTSEQVSHVRLIRSDRVNRFMVLVKFREAEAAKKWQKEWNAKLFSSMEPEDCQIVFIKSISFQAADVNKDPASFPDMSNDPFTPAISRPPITPQSAISDPFNPPALVELPTCPVCLERMDDTTGLATIFCQHVFHCNCLQKWRGTGCPVCRYTQDEPLHKSKSHVNDDTGCSTCGADSNLWICLICGNIGCGRYDGRHAQQHYQQTGHTFAMDMNDQHIWNYAGEHYVHRLLQDKSNGKLVELPSAFSSGARGHNHDDDLPWEKVEKMSHEYTTLITSQLDSQRMYFEEQVERAVDKASKATAAAESANRVALEDRARMLDVAASQTTLLEETLPALERDKARLERRAEKAESLARNMRKDAQEKEAMNESLLERVKLLQNQVEELTKSKSELEEMNRDLMTYMTCAEKLKDAGEEVQQGTITVANAPRRKKNGKK